MQRKAKTNFHHRSGRKPAHRLMRALQNKGHSCPDLEQNERRNVQKALLKALDGALPRENRSAPVKNCAGTRSLGDKGRSLHNVLADTVSAVRRLVKDEDADAGPMTEQFRPFQHPLLDTHTIGESLFASRDMFVLEVSMPGWSVVRLGEGAKEFYRKSPFGDMHRQSLNNLMDWEDIPNILSVWEEMRSPGFPAHRSGQRTADVRLIYFNKYPCLGSPPDARSDDQPNNDSLLDLSHEAFLPDPLLDQTAPPHGARPGDQAHGVPKASDAQEDFYVAEFVTVQCRFHAYGKHGAVDRILVVASGLHEALQARVRFDSTEIQVSA